MHVWLKRRSFSCAWLEKRVDSSLG